MFSRQRQLSVEKLQVAKDRFRQMQANGIVSPSKSDWSSALHIVTCPGGKCKICGDYRALNAITVRDCYPIPNINSVFF